MTRSVGELVTTRPLWNEGSSASPIGPNASTEAWRRRAPKGARGADNPPGEGVSRHFFGPTVLLCDTSTPPPIGIPRSLLCCQGSRSRRARREAQRPPDIRRMNDSALNNDEAAQRPELHRRRAADRDRTGIISLEGASI
jgi:hypothetical protein